MESVAQILKQNNELYEVTWFKSIGSFAGELGRLKRVGKEDFGKKCASVKGIILVNAFQLILECLCEEKWEFLLEGVLDSLLAKVALQILASALHHWDHYLVYYFFDRLAAGRVRHRQLTTTEPPPTLSEKLVRVKALSEESWGHF